MATGPQDKLVKYVEDNMTCPLCYERYKEPRSLPCLHTICTPCLETHVAKTQKEGKYSCPYCRQETDLPTEGVAGFPVAFLHVGLAESLEKVAAFSGSTEMHCEPCKSHETFRKAVGQCPSCNVKLCEHCQNSHAHVSTDHTTEQQCGYQTVSRAEQLAIVTCAEHSEEFDYFCETCMVKICHECLIDKHQSHDTVKFETAVRKHKSQLKTRKAELDLTLAKYEGVLENTESAIADAKEQKTSASGVIKKMIHETMTRLEEEAMKEVNKCCDATLVELQTIKDNLQNQKEKAQTCRDGVQTVLKDEIPLDIINTSTMKAQDISQTAIHMKLPKLHLTTEKPSAVIHFSSVVNIKCNVKSASSKQCREELLPTPIFVPVIRQLTEHRVSNASSCFPYRIQCTSNDDKILFCNNSQTQICTLTSNEGCGYRLHVDIKYSSSVLDVECTGGKVYVADGTRSPGGVFVFCENTGKLLHWIPVGFPDKTGKGAVGIAVADKTLYVASFSDSNVVYSSVEADKETKVCPFISKPDCAELEGPQYIAATCDFVAVSCARHKVLIFNRKAELQGVYGSGVAGSAIGQLRNPTGVLFDPKGNVIVVDHGNNRLCVVSTAAKHLTCFACEKSPIQSRKITFNNDNQLLIAYGEFRNTYMGYTYHVYKFEYKHYTKEETNKNTCISLITSPQKETRNHSTQTMRAALDNQDPDATHLSECKPATETLKMTERKVHCWPTWFYIAAVSCLCLPVALYFYQ